ncbi:MAG: choice-of-anchor D domain-containing protein, partial [Bacteroidota bacterium]
DAPAETHLGDQGGIWFDLDGDGWQDIAIGQMGYPTANTKGQERLYILKQNSEHYFDDVSKAVGIYYTMKEAHSVQPGDFDLDGDQDLFFSRQVRDTTYRDTIINGQTQKVPVLKNYMRIFLLRNDIGNKNNWVSVKLDPPQGSNKSGLGSRITVCADSMKFISEIQTGYGHFAGEQPFIKNIGIGKLNRIDSIVVRWQVKGFPTSVIYNPALNMILGINGNSQLSYVKPWTDKKPVISFSKPALRFDTISIGNNQEQSFDVKNLGDTTLVVSDMTLDSSASTVYSILGKQVPFSLAPDETKNINIKFTPLVRADYHKTIRFSSNAQNAPERNYDLIGSGYAPAPVIIADSISLTFNPAWVDTLRQRSFQVNNPGEEALVLSDFSFESDSMNVFSIDKSSLPITIQPKSSQTLTVSFKPVKLGVSNANLLITSNAYNGASLKVKLSGTCDGPAPSIYSNTLVMFGTVPINLFKEKIIWILNNGNADLHISGITVEDDTAGVYTISDLQYPYSVHPDDTLFVTVRFTPKQTISYNKTLIISSDAFSSPTRKVNLKGTGDPAVSVAEATKLLLFTMKVQPNPAETNAKLIFELNGGEPQSVHLELYSTAGIKIRDIANESINPGSYSSELNTSALPAGVYYISAKVGQYLYHTKLILLK